MFTNIVAFSLALIPFFFWQGWDEGIRTPKETACVICLAVIIIAGFSRFDLKKFFNRWFLIFLGWGVFTLLLSNHSIPLFLQNGIVSLPSNMVAFKSLFYISLALLAIQAISVSDIDLKKISKIIAIVCIVMCLYSFLQLFGLDEWFTVADPGTGWVGKSIWEGDINQIGHYSRRIVGTVGNPSILGIFLALCLPFHIYQKNRLGLSAFALSGLIILLTLSLTAYIASIVSVMVILFFKNRKIFTAALLAFLILGVAVSHIPKMRFLYNPTGRIEVLKEGFRLLHKKAITGFGLGSWEYMIGMNPEAVRKLNNQNWKEAHNEYFQVWFEAGIIGLMIFLMGIMSAGIKFLKNTTEEAVYMASSMAAFLVVCLTYFPMRVAPLSFYGVIIFGLLNNKTGEAR